ncbi:bifunctional phosphoribosylaminoimidazolecarboxamide formyltransferase/IMP cyclohydrolase [Peptoniphilus catoniae]|uniref:bifunctional phosphoribosylaminoimidazolecarboxamide formyltransferase/IMP cyclohydrolase n=1 Tax=Peptoniphilus catoniae TaxID=1660341 RepID=UPI0010FE3340|nr:bifunctional phosphoribosylaminoimidazolecarboxamide formyltransferase/IMP cyclohydrolase [Peptoniphilus catoniae]
MRALISVTDKSNLKFLVKGLSDLGCEIISTGGTLKAIKEAGVEAVSVENVTNFKEILGGRVKTLSPYIHGGILYRRDNPQDVETIKNEKISPIDIVVVNLYDFSGALETKDKAKIIENIDIGGPTLIRAAAKNYKDVLVVTDVCDYERLIEKLKTDSVDESFRAELATKAFSLTSYYDSLIARYFKEETGKETGYLNLGFEKAEDLRYGENPTQKAALYKDKFINSYLSNPEIIHGKKMSFNNYNDLNVAVELAAELGKNTAVALKHATPCAVSKQDNLLDSYLKAYEADSLSIFGGILALNGEVDEKLAEECSKIFLEIIAAKDFTKGALEILTKKKNIRLVKVDFDLKKADMDIKYLNGAVLCQEKDQAEDEFSPVTNKLPTEKETEDLKFAMKVVKHVKSNAVVVVKDKTTIGIGGGETSRIWALENIKNHYDKSFDGGVLASDAFFPFDDCVKLAGQMGLTSIIQPGGSLRDEDSIKKCNELGISMVFSKNRHFKH